MEHSTVHAKSNNTGGEAAANQAAAPQTESSAMRIPEQNRRPKQPEGNPVTGSTGPAGHREHLSPFVPSVKTGNLPDDVQAKMERSFAEDFSDVRVFRDSDLAVNMHAAALTRQNEIHFAPGYDPYASGGGSLLGHELSHVVQQRQGRVTPTHYEGGVGVNDARDLEAEADRQGSQAARGEIIRPAGGVRSPHAVLQKKSSVVQMWRPLPGQARVENVECSADDAFMAVRNAIANAWGRWVDDIASEFRPVLIGRMTEELTGNLGIITVNNFKTYSGYNLTWRGDIQFKIDGIRQIGGGGVGSTTMGAGGTTTTGTSGTDTETGSSTMGGTISSSPASTTGGTGGELTVGTSSGTSSARTDSASHTSNATNNSTIKQTLNRYRASIACFVNLSCEFSVGDSGWDYVNPFQWGVALRSAVDGSYHGFGSTRCGEVTYYMGDGIAP